MNPFEASRDVKEVIVWRLVAEMMRRHPDRLWVCQADTEDSSFESEPSPNLVRVAVAFPEFEGLFADFNMDVGQTVRFVSPEESMEMTEVWQMPLEMGDLHGLLNHLTADIGIKDYVHDSMPPTMPGTLAFRTMAGIASAVMLNNHRWRWLNAVKRGPDDWSPAVLRSDLVRFFADLDVPEPRYRDVASARHDPAYAYWILTRDGEPQVCISTDGGAYTRGGSRIELMPIYEGTRGHGTPGRVAPVVAIVGRDFLP